MNDIFIICYLLKNSTLYDSISFEWLQILSEALHYFDEFVVADLFVTVKVGILYDFLKLFQCEVFAKHL